MTRHLAAFAWVTLGLMVHGQERPYLADVLGFEAQSSGSVPAGWDLSSPGIALLDDNVAHGGRWSVRVERQAGTVEQFPGVFKSLPVDFAGTTVELRGFIRTEGVTGFASFLVRVTGDWPQTGTLATDTLAARQIKGNTEWTEYSLSVPVTEEARHLVIGFLVTGNGKAWADDLQLLVDGKPIWDAPKAERPRTILDSDREFDGGSKVAPSELSPVQIENVATLGKVWGFLKYHHPQVTSGRRHWDYDLFRILPAVLAAPDRAAGNAVIAKWVDALGAPGECHPCAKLDETELHLRPDLKWIDSGERLGADLSRMLRAIYRNRLADGKQFYVSLAPGTGNPRFVNERSYEGLKLPDAGLQLLSLFRFWNIIEYWFPYRDILGEDWDQVLGEFIPRIGLAKTTEDYQRELMALIVKVHDSHANLWSSLGVRPPVGDCQVPVIVRFIENRAVVTGYAGANAGPATELRRGDVIETLDGVPVLQLVEKWKPYYAGSNEAAVLREMALMLTRGACGDARIGVRRESQTLELTAKRVTGVAYWGPGFTTHDLPGDTFRRLSNDVAYLKLSSVRVADLPHYVEAAAGTKGLIIDIRNYPSEFVAYTLGALLADKETPFVRFTKCDLANPGAFHFEPSESLTPGKQHYSGKVVILVDELSQSQAEFTAMAFRAVPNASVVGSTTAGADGNTSDIMLPGNLESKISALGAFYPDKRPTQRIGIIPDLVVKPTIAGVRAGLDEVLEAALRQILGPDVPTAAIEKLAGGGAE